MKTWVAGGTKERKKCNVFTLVIRFLIDQSPLDP